MYKLKILLLRVLQRNENQWTAAGEYLQIISHIKIRGQCRDYMKKPINSYRRDKQSNYKCSMVFSGYFPPKRYREIDRWSSNISKNYRVWN